MWHARSVLGARSGGAIRRRSRSLHRHTGRRTPTWELTPAEHTAIERARHDPIGLLELMRLVASTPSLVPELLGIAAASGRQALAAHAGLAWLLDAERGRRAAPGTARGAGWKDESLFVPTLLAHVRPDMVALDLGSGAGRIARHIAPHVRRLVCCDVSRTMLAEARRNLSSFANVELVRTRGFTLASMPNGAFDLVYAQGVFPYFDPLQALALLAEVARVLRPAGLSIVNFYTIDDPDDAVVARSDALRSAARGSFTAYSPRPYTRGYLRALYRAAGLDVCEIRTPDAAMAAARVPAIVLARTATSTPGDPS